MPQEETMKLKFAIVGLAALFGLAAAGSASAMPLGPTFYRFKRRERCRGLRPQRLYPQGARLPRIRLRLSSWGYGYRGGGYGVRRYGHVHRGYGYHRGYRR